MQDPASAKAGGGGGEATGEGRWKGQPEGMATVLSTAAATEWAETSASHRCVGRRRTLYHSFLLYSALRDNYVVHFKTELFSQINLRQVQGGLFGSFWLVGCFACCCFFCCCLVGCVLLLFWGFFLFVCFALLLLLTQQLLGPWRVSRSILAGEVCTGSLQRSQSHRII